MAERLMQCFWELLSLLWVLILPMGFLCGLLIALAVLLVVAVRFWLQRKKDVQRTGDGHVNMAFFYPFCNVGGVTERVLWCAIKTLQNKYQDINFVVYTGDRGVTGRQILENVRLRFNVALPRPVRFVFLRNHLLVDPGSYPHLTLLGQSIGSFFLGLEALTEFTPDVYFDLTGYALTMPLFRYLGGCSVGSYILTPIVNPDMLTVVSMRMSRLDNRGIFSDSLLLDALKVLYYSLFTILYGFASSCSDLIMVSSSWTLSHILSMWRTTNYTAVVYPPCDVSSFSDIPIDGDGDKKGHSIVSIGQFTREKDHRLQIRIFKRVLERTNKDLKLVLIGGCRSKEEEDRVLLLRGLCQELGLGDKVEFKVNVSFCELKKAVGEATIGLHTMRNEAFGMGVVSCMAAGKIILANKSGGSNFDIVLPFEGGQTGFLADGEDSYVAAIEHILLLPADTRLQIRRNARQSATRFADCQFEADFLTAIEPLIEKIW